MTTSAHDHQRIDVAGQLQVVRGLKPAVTHLHDRRLGIGRAPDRPLPWRRLIASSSGKRAGASATRASRSRAAALATEPDRPCPGRLPLPGLRTRSRAACRLERNIPPPGACRHAPRLHHAASKQLVERLAVIPRQRVVIDPPPLVASAHRSGATRATHLGARGAIAAHHRPGSTADPAPIDHAHAMTFRPDSKVALRPWCDWAKSCVSFRQDRGRDAEIIRKFSRTLSSRACAIGAASIALRTTSKELAAITDARHPGVTNLGHG